MPFIIKRQCKKDRVTIFKKDETLCVVINDIIGNRSGGKEVNLEIIGQNFSRNLIIRESGSWYEISPDIKLGIHKKDIRNSKRITMVYSFANEYSISYLKYLE